jgi:hypothetical protein
LLVESRFKANVEQRDIRTGQDPRTTCTGRGTGPGLPLRIEGDMDMAARVDEIAEDVFRICTHRSDGLAAGMVYNQSLVRAEQPLLIHTGMRTIFPGVAEAVGRLMRLRDLRWISGGGGTPRGPMSSGRQPLPRRRPERPGGGRKGCGERVPAAHGGSTRPRTGRW